MKVYYKRNVYNVEFNLNGGKGEIEQVKIKAGKNLEEPQTPTRDGYEFIGWYDNLSDPEKFDFQKNPIMGDIKLHIIWKMMKKMMIQTQKQ